MSYKIVIIQGIRVKKSSFFLKLLFLKEKHISTHPIMLCIEQNMKSPALPYNSLLF